MIVKCIAQEKLSNGRTSYKFALQTDAVNEFVSLIVWADAGTYIYGQDYMINIFIEKGVK